MSGESVTQVDAMLVTHRLHTYIRKSKALVFVHMGGPGGLTSRRLYGANQGICNRCAGHSAGVESTSFSKLSIASCPSRSACLI